MTFQRATKFQSKLRLALAGPAGSGKTYTALTLATALADGQSVALIDTEHGSASKYADIFGFDTLQLETFHPNKYIEAIHEAEAAGYAVLVIDSLSHAWSGVGGLLEVVENITKRSNSKNSFNAWGEATPLQNRLIDTIIRSKLHIIATMRSKTEYIIEQNSQGRTAPRKVGMAPVQRADVEYEFDVYADMDIDNTLIVHKSRCPALSGAVIIKPDGAVAETLKAWLSGETPPQPLQPSPNGATSNSTSTNGKAMPPLQGQGNEAHTSEWKPIYDNGKARGAWKDVSEFYAKVSGLFEEKNVNKAFLDGLDPFQLSYLKRETEKPAQGAA